MGRVEKQRIANFCLLGSFENESEIVHVKFIYILYTFVLCLYKLLLFARTSNRFVFVCTFPNEYLSARPYVCPRMCKVIAHFGSNGTKREHTERKRESERGHINSERVRACVSDVVMHAFQVCLAACPGLLFFPLSCSGYARVYTYIRRYTICVCTK